MEHIIEFEPGYDCIKFECRHGSNRCKPGEGGSHGKHGMNLRFVVKGEEGAVQFLLYTGWMPMHREDVPFLVQSTLDHNSPRGGPMPADLGYHSKKAQYPDQKPIHASCKYTDGGPCYYDGSGLNADDAMYALVNGGGEGLWKFLEEYYKCVFEGAPYPTPCEYPMPLREK